MSLRLVANQSGNDAWCASCNLNQLWANALNIAELWQSVKLDLHQHRSMSTSHRECFHAVELGWHWQLEAT